MDPVNRSKQFNASSSNKKIRPFHVLLTLLLFLTAGCAPQDQSNSSGLDQPTNEFKTMEIQPDAQVSTPAKPVREDTECPELDSQLYQLIQLDDPAGEAAKLGMKVKEDKVQVMITLMDENTAFLSDFDAELGTQSGSLAQAYVPFSQLCRLANVDSVLAIRPAAQPIP